MSLSADLSLPRSHSATNTHPVVKQDTRTDEIVKDITYGMYFAGKTPEDLGV